MKKTLSIIATVAAFAGLGLALASGTVAHAAVDANGTGALTDANITLKTGDTSQGAGGITLTDAPSYTFSAATLDGTAQSVDTTATGNLTVKNPGVASGWNVTVKNDKMTDGTHTLDGGSLVLTSTGASSTDTTNTTKPATPTASQTVTMGTGTDGTTAQPVMTAAAEKGLGIWDANYTKATLNIPASAVAADSTNGSAYRTNLTWTLSNAPA
ncbi:WxL domain-containing protein [Levilactobacillus brevis]|uniref:WxL domain-containing protein n=1 Tax=Levilactobacillus brevis TaxID=1580 RepID=UPI001C1EB507|nr:WxL domain-containing protein [Levilactobacillus brevis]MBU7539577.1 WxL domain-containing protein [Levilactobacillus brevis]MBU7559494.1 WxL domain-containing protein [Levilactobacillus brevis]MBU7565779.1 WxL domain-containing protein [Levilactobacillus brevis]MCE6011066.1 WxL domain-containing protein [Levilactobacillus brevis]MCE6012859.1 WxL domain-containing protein [Levilactobacillus brevis]